MDTQIERIKAGLSIAAAWTHLGLRGRPARECRSPFRDDKHASFSVYTAKDGERWYDHGTASGGDVLDLWARAKDLTLQVACADILSAFPQLADPPRRTDIPHSGGSSHDPIKAP